MITEYSCGAVVFTREDGCIRYVIIRSKEGFYGFPKGHREGAESEEETALREILEETGLTVMLLDGFRTEDCYSFTCDGETRMKHVVYFLAKYAHQTPTVQVSELDSIRLMDYDAAMNAFQFENSRRILSEAYQFLTTKLW